MTYWAGLYGEMDREQLVEGINTMLKIAEKILKRKRGDTEAEAVNRLQDGVLAHRIIGLGELTTHQSCLAPTSVTERPLAKPTTNKHCPTTQTMARG